MVGEPHDRPEREDPEDHDRPGDPARVHAQGARGAGRLTRHGAPRPGTVYLTSIRTDPGSGKRTTELAGETKVEDQRPDDPGGHERYDHEPP